MRILYLIGFVLFSFLTLQNYKNSHIEYFLADSEGINVLVTVERIPGLCQSRNNRILVKYKERDYSILISNKSCINGVYRVGNKVEMIYVSRFDKLLFKASNSTFKYIMSIVFFMLPLGFLIVLLKKKNQV